MTAGEITSTAEIAEREWGDHSEPGNVESDIVATREPEGKGIEFTVSMRDYTQRDMEGLIIEAAAQLIVGRRGEREMAKVIEAKCIELVARRADEALAKVADTIIDQPLTPSFGDKKPVTMREFIGLTGREYLSATVDGNGNPTTKSGWGSSGRPRIEYLVAKYMDRRFTQEIEKATNAVISEVRASIKAQHDALLAAEKKRFADALAKTTA